MVRCFCVVMMAGLVAAIGCEQKSSEPTPKVSADDVRRDAGQAVNTVADFSQQTKEDFQKSLDLRLTKLDAEIAELRLKGRDLKEEAKDNWHRNMADLETKREAARGKLSEVGKASAAAWKDVGKGAQSAWEELDKAFRDASREF